MNIILLPFLVGIIIFFIVMVVVNTYKDTMSSEEVVVEKDEAPDNLYVRLLLPYAKLVAGVLRPFFREQDQTIFFQETRKFSLKEYFFRGTSWYKNKIQKLLISAGKQEQLDPLEIIGFQFVAAVIGGMLGYFLYAQVPYPSFLWLFPTIGFFFPVISINDAAKNRSFEIRIHLPYFLDLLCLAVEAGLDFTAALKRLADKGGDNALNQEVNRMIQQIQLGKPRPEALREFGQRIDIEEAKSVVGALIQADDMGSPLGPILRIQSDQLRIKRSQRAEKLAQEAPVKMLLPLIGCIFPTVFIVLFGPIALQVLNTSF